MNLRVICLRAILGILGFALPAHIAAAVSFPPLFIFLMGCAGIFCGILASTYIEEYL